jgi:hypothetical protein
MNLAMKTNSIDKYIYILECWPYQYWKLGKKNYLQKHSYIFKYLKSTFQSPKIKGPIQVLASALKKYYYINLGFETNANNS